MTEALLFKAGVVTTDAARRQFSDGAVRLRDDVIEEALKRDDFVVVGEVVSPYVAFGLPDPLRSIEATRLAGTVHPIA